MDVVTAYLYGSLDSDIYIKVPDGIPVLNVHVNHNMYYVKLVKLLYGLKQSERIWYNRLKELLLNRGYSTGFCIISIYVDELNIICHTKDIDEARNHLKTEFKMKDLGRTNFYLALQLEHLHTSILVHQSAYIQKILEKFNMDKAYSARTPIIVHAMEKDTNPFRLKEEGEEVLGQEYSYLSAISALMYLTNNTRPDIAFTVNCLTRQRGSYNASLKRH
jgi:hypothetical protein